MMTISTNVSEEIRFWTGADFLPDVLRLLMRGESEDPGLAGISVSSGTASAFDVVCFSMAARAARSLLTQDCRECATGTDFNEDTGDDGFDEADESGDFGSCVGFLVDGWAAFGFFDCQQLHVHYHEYTNTSISSAAAVNWKRAYQMILIELEYFLISQWRSLHLHTR